MSITAALVKELRDVSGAGMMDAKKALTENNGDMDAAIDWLRTKGLATAAKKSNRTAAEGLVAVDVSDGTGVVIEVNSETDFVAKNQDFQNMVGSFAKCALSVSDIDSLNGTLIADKKVSEILTDKIATVGENMSLRRMAKLSGDTVASYIHNSVAPGMGKIGVLVALKGDNSDFAKQVAMHVAATNPASLSENDLSSDILSREKSILTEQARESGKPEQVIEKMIEGRLKKFLADVTLLGQNFVINPDLTVGKAAAEVGVEILGFLRFEVGEGIEKKQENFAEEVAAQLKA
ncbi:MAG: elongation factor Ts [Rhodobacteraceae bacterium]|jgi:elongation factor Ts|nr:elongation factor Ts [Paracoccaceae bacterium]MBT4777324.1 elongation factor Ts [Paracoccaceae bacterium]|tara:strand:+ start:479 stop:1354 length:876 start_codon:yes stop_codon:yes gene_type:complete